MVRKIIFLSLIALPIFGALKERPVLLFNDITCAASNLRTECDSYENTDDRLAHFATFLTCTSQQQFEADVRVPSSGECVRIFLDLAKRNLVIRGKKDICLQAYAHGSSSMHIGRLDAEREVVTGNEIMHIVEGFCECCAFEHVSLFDASRCEGFELLKLLPYCTGRSWYAKFGFIPDSRTDEEMAKRALLFITQRPMRALMHDFKGNKEVTAAIEALFKITGTNHDSSFGECMQLLYARYRTTIHALQSPVGKLLDIFYRHCMADYTAQCPLQEPIKAAQERYFFAWGSLEKAYDRPSAQSQSYLV